MRGNRCGAVGRCVLAGLLYFAGVTTGWADHFRPLSSGHILYGVSQLNYGNVAQIAIAQNNSAIKFMNPNHVTQAVASFVYSSDRGQSGVGQPTEVFYGCKVNVVTPHGSTDVTDAELAAAGVPQGKPLYSEHIWAPLEKITVSQDDEDERSQRSDRRRRIADGLGGNTEALSYERMLRLAHPGLFSLPSNSVVAGQRERAARCICAELAAQRLSSDLFSDFGVRC